MGECETMSPGEMLATAWIRNDLCKARGWSEPPSGVPLWRLRCSEREVDRMRNLLVKYLRPGSTPTRHVAGMFSLYAAETLRRSYAGGTWKWDIATQSFDRDMVQDDWRQLTEAGLRFWNRPLRRGEDSTRYLQSL